MTHELKILPVYFQAVLSGDKTFEVRENSDRGFQKGDTVFLNETKDYESNSGPSGNFITAEILYVSNFNQKENIVVFSFKVLNKTIVEERF